MSGVVTGITWNRQTPNMPRLHVRLDGNLKKAYSRVCEQYGVDMSTLIRAKIREIVDDEKDKIPDHIYANAMVEAIKEEKNPGQQAMHIPSNFAQQVRRLLEKRHPPTPQEVKRNYVDGYYEQLELFYEGELLKRKKAQVMHSFRLYKMSHPDSDADTDRVQKAVADMAFSLKKEEDMETARHFVQRLVEDGVLPEAYHDETIDMVRDMNQDQWESDWNDAVWGELDA